MAPKHRMTRNLDLSPRLTKVEVEEAKVAKAKTFTHEVHRCTECGDPAWYGFFTDWYCKWCAPEWLRKPTTENAPRSG